MKVGTKLFLTLGIFIFLFSTFLLYRTYSISDHYANLLVSEQADLALQFDLAIRKYVAEKIRPVMYSLIDEDEFIPETMSTSFVARSIFEEVRHYFPDFILKFSSDNPRNPVNKASPEELEIIRYFNENSSEKQWRGEITIGGTRYVARFEARRMREECLHCHGDPMDAPASLLADYGSVAGFYRQVGSTIALDTIAIPVTTIKQQIWSDFSSNFMLTGLGILVLLLTVFLSVKYLISNRLAMITRHFTTVSDQDDYMFIEPLLVRGNDEVSALATGFNTLADKVRKFHISLDEQVKGKTIANQKLLQEIEERKKIENRLRLAESRYRNIFENAVDGIYQTSLEGKLLHANPAFARILGYDSADEIISGVQDIGSQLYVNPDRRQELLASLDQNASVHGFEIQLYRKDGSQVWIMVNARKTFDSEQQFHYIEGVAQDITDRKKAEELLAEEKERLAVTLQSIGDGVITTDTEGRVVMINKVAQRLTGWLQEDARGKGLEEVFRIVDEKNRQKRENPVDRVLQTGQVVELANHTILIARDGTERFIADSGAPIFDYRSRIIGVVLVFRDVTEKQQLENEAVKVQKLESLGVLAGGIAHDFNNILTAVIGNISLAKLKLPSESPVQQSLVKAENAIMRARDLTQQLLTFAKGGAPVKTTVSVTDLVRDSATFALRGSNVRCDFAIDPALWPIDADIGQINQVISNLVINADQAMPDGGVIAISLDNTMIKEKSSLPLKPGRYIRISIRDQGIGIPSDHLPMIFDPYFTTKKTGSGLGLATVYSIISRHGGHLTVQSSLGSGTTFLIYLPASDKQRPQETAPEVQLFTGRGNILVMDDDQEVREVAGDMLTELGYLVDFAADGMEALEKYQLAAKSGTPFNLVIMDLTIPGGMGGQEAIKKLLELDPAARAIVSSGFSVDPVMANYKAHGFAGFVSKPYNTEKLSQILKTVLAGQIKPPVELPE